MPRPHPDSEKLIQLTALCREAVQAQRDREIGHGYGLDDYSEGRIVGAANLARKILRAVTGNDAIAAPRGSYRRNSLVG